MVRLDLFIIVVRMRCLSVFVCLFNIYFDFFVVCSVTSLYSHINYIYVWPKITRDMFTQQQVWTDRPTECKTMPRHTSTWHLCLWAEKAVRHCPKCGIQNKTRKNQQTQEVLIKKLRLSPHITLSPSPSLSVSVFHVVVCMSVCLYNF